MKHSKTRIYSGMNAEQQSSRAAEQQSSRAANPDSLKVIASSFSTLYFLLDTSKLGAAYGERSVLIILRVQQRHLVRNLATLLTHQSRAHLEYLSGNNR